MKLKLASVYFVLWASVPASPAAADLIGPGLTVPLSNDCRDWERIYEDGPRNGFRCWVDDEPLIVLFDCAAYPLDCVDKDGRWTHRVCVECDPPLVIEQPPVGAPAIRSDRAL